MATWAQQAAREFTDAVGGEAAFAADAGGRVNLIGEHTDYHEGFVFPAAIDLRTRVAARPRTDGVLRIRSLNLSEEVEAVLADLVPPPVADWRAYVLGPFWALREAGIAVPGADIVVNGGVPFGGGLSSSASIEVALVAVGAALAGRDLPAIEIARLARRAENGFCNVPCGAMDQMASACGKEGHALLLDCRTLTFETVPMPAAWVLVVADSGVRHAVAGPEYANRQKECAQGMAVVRAAFPDVAMARDLTMERLDGLKARMPEVSYRRLRHAVTENDRCLAARDALVRGDGATLGRLLAGSHESLARDYEVSCAELDILVAAAVGIRGCVGARLTGAGFGGNTVNVVEAGEAAAFCDALARAYHDRTGRPTTVRVVRPAAGVSVTCLRPMQ
jgi:galactokinase